MTVLIADVVRSPEVQFTLEKCFPGAVQKINSGLVSQSSSVILDFGRRAIATLVFGTWGAVQAIGACMIVVVDLLGPSKYSILDAIQTMKYTVNKNDLTVERTRRISLELLEGDPIIRAAYAQGWEDRTEDTHLNIQAWNPSPTRSLNIFTPPTERLSIADEQTGCKITPVEKKLGLTTTSAQIAAPPTRKPTGDQHSLAKKRGKAIQQTGDGIGDQISMIVWSCSTRKKLTNNTMISYNAFLWANNLVQFDEATLQVSQIKRIVEIPRSILPNASLDGFIYSGIQPLVNSKVQWEYLTCLFGEIVHGGHITEEWARKLCLTHLKVNVNPAENADRILNDDTNEITYYDHFSHFDAIENPETDKLQNVFNDYSNSSPKLPLTVFSEEIQKLLVITQKYAKHKSNACRHPPGVQMAMAIGNLAGGIRNMLQVWQAERALDDVDSACMQPRPVTVYFFTDANRDQW
ncbi:hypothetical protein QTP88_023737 [Uroleucon formosanum]